MGGRLCGIRAGDRVSGGSMTGDLLCRSRSLSLSRPSLPSPVPADDDGLYDPISGL